MNVFDMTKEDFNKVTERGGWSRDIGEFSALVIIPQDYENDSGWMCMDFVAVSKEGEPICRLSGYSDVLELCEDEFLRISKPKEWRIDCLPCGYLRLFSRSTLTAGPTLSSLEIYAK